MCTSGRRNPRSSCGSDPNAANQAAQQFAADYYGRFETDFFKIARDWNARDGNVGYVLRFEVAAEALHRWPPQQGAAGATFRELWVPAEELEEFNAVIRGRIETVAVYRS